MTAERQDKTGSRRTNPRAAAEASARKAKPTGRKGKVVKVPVPPHGRPAGGGTPDDALLREVLARLGAADQDAVRRVLSLLAEHLGSPEAAQLWLVTLAPEFGTTPLEAMAAGKAKLVLAVLESRWGPNPAYA
jgi:hypothetical protein